MWQRASSWHQQRLSRGSREKTVPSKVSPILNPSWKRKSSDIEPHCHRWITAQTNWTYSSSLNMRLGEKQGSDKALINHASNASCAQQEAYMFSICKYLEMFQRYHSRSIAFLSLCLCCWMIERLLFSLAVLSVFSCYEHAAFIDAIYWITWHKFLNALTHQTHMWCDAACCTCTCKKTKWPRSQQHRHQSCGYEPSLPLRVGRHDKKAGVNHHKEEEGGGRNLEWALKKWAC